MPIKDRPDLEKNCEKMQNHVLKNWFAVLLHISYLWDQLDLKIVLLMEL